MPRFAPLLVLLLGLLALPAAAQVPPAATAQPDNPYTVTGVEVDVKGSSGVNARDKAFTEGGRAALKILASRLSGAKEPDLKGVDDNAITRLIKSFEVEKEKVSGARYIGTLTYHFKPEVSAAFLEMKGFGVQASNGPTGAGAPPISVAEGLMRVVVLPVVRVGNRSILWEEKTNWARAWENYLSDNPNPNFAVPEGTMEDIGTISTAEALAGIPAPLQKIMRRYEAHGVLVAVLAGDSTTPNQAVSVQLASFDARGMLRNTSSFTLPAQPQRKPMEWLQDGAAYAIGLSRQQTDKMAEALSAISPQPTPVVARPFGFLQIVLSVPFANVEQWQRYRTSLQEIDNMMRLDIQSLTRTHATVQITYRGMRSGLDAALAEKGLRLEETAPDNILLVPSVLVAPPPPTVDSSEDSTGENSEDAPPPSVITPQQQPPLSPPPPPVDVPSHIP